MFSYSSGTTGDPKAVMLSHANILATATSAHEVGVYLDHTDTLISYLPYAHSFE